MASVVTLPARGWRVTQIAADARRKRAEAHARALHQGSASCPERTAAGERTAKSPAEIDWR